MFCLETGVKLLTFSWAVYEECSHDKQPSTGLETACSNGDSIQNSGNGATQNTQLGLEAAGGEKFVGGEDKGVITEQVSIAIADSAPGERSIGQVSRNVPLPAGKRGKVRMRTVGPALTHNNICSTLFTKLPGCIDMACEL